MKAAAVVEKINFLLKKLFSCLHFGHTNQTSQNSSSNPPISPTLAHIPSSPTLPPSHNSHQSLHCITSLIGTSWNHYQHRLHNINSNNNNTFNHHICINTNPPKSPPLFCPTNAIINQISIRFQPSPSSSATNSTINPNPT